MKHTASKQMFQYWNDLRGDRLAPDREEIDPASLRSVLGDTFILEIEPEYDARFRLAGTRICSAYCRELKGQKYLSLWSAEEAVAISTLLRGVGEDSGAVVLGITATSERGRTVATESLLLPLTLQGQPNARLIGTHAPMEQPFWLGIDPIAHQTVSSVRLIMPDDVERLGRPQANIETPAVPILREVDNGGRRYGHLSVVDGGVN